MHRVLASIIAWVLLGAPAAADAPTPLLAADEPVDWWFAIKFNSKTAATDPDAVHACAFGGQPKPYAHESLSYAVASSKTPTLQAGAGLIGASSADPLGATYGAVYSGDYYYVVWNDQFYEHPKIKGCEKSCASPWGHSKGLVAWDEAGNGLVLQVTTPSWPAAASKANPRVGDGNTLGCVADDDVEVSQHFFALKLVKHDLVQVLAGLANASVATDVKNPQLVKNGGPADVQAHVKALGVKSKSVALHQAPLSSGVQLIAKPSDLHAPPWQIVSAMLKGAPLRVASWWAWPEIPSTTEAGAPGCWASSLSTPGPVDIATSGTWDGEPIGLKGGLGTDYNHAKFGVTTAPGSTRVIFGDMNQQGTLSGPKCHSSQNGRGGLFFVLDNAALHKSVSALLKGASAPAE